jgi:hypothetical protein
MSITIRSGAAPASQAAARARASGPQRSQQRRIAGDPVDHPKRRGVGGDRPEQRLLVADRAQIGQAIAAVGQHHRQIPDDPAGIVAPTAFTHRRQRTRERVGEPEPIGRLGQ